MHAYRLLDACITLSLRIRCRQRMKSTTHKEIHIGEAARRLGVTPHHLRVLEWRGRIPPARRDLNGRVYSELDIALLRAIGVGSRPGRLKQAEEVLGVAE